jgi:hypothetical protein
VASGNRVVKQVIDVSVSDIRRVQFRVDLTCYIGTSQDNISQLTTFDLSDMTDM